ncbi:carbohydrate deacetylase [Pristis pectinata]|uniref:carbohydrate deacetylase n=1 Tax=Pristis pectinata TaxID=685728 RepID=UPI00223E14B4|nr:carbohydrate deacetylase [Pristis pectinata]
MPQPRVRLIVTGDDFGYCQRRNRGIMECFRAKAISNASLLVNGTAAKEAAAMAIRNKVPLGLHANLSEGLPVCEQLRMGSSLVNNDGFFHGKMGIREVLKSGHINLSEVDKELRGQVDLFCEMTGFLPHHMDGHQHVHVLPGIRDVFAQVLSDYGIVYTRVPVEPGLRCCDRIGQQLMDFYLQVEKDAFNSIDVFQRHGIRWPDIYIGLTTMGKNMSVSNIQTTIENAIATRKVKQHHLLEVFPADAQRQDGTILTMELMVHPGYSSFPEEGGCGEGPDEFSLSADRFHELETLKAPKLLKYYEQRNIQLCAFKDL